MLVIAVSALAGAAYFGRFALAPANPGQSDPVIIEVIKGQSPSEISKTLAEKGLVQDARQMFWLGRVLRSWPKVKAGEYQLTANMTPMEILSTISSGVSLRYPLTVREGENMYEIAADLDSKGFAKKERFLALCRDPQLMKSLGFTEPLPVSLEGYLFPDTYHITRSMLPEDIIKLMFKRFTSVWGEPQDERAKQIGMNRHQIVTLASIIERETGASGERPLISSVFHNRLKKRMRLQSDPTTIYGMWERYQGNIRREDLLEQTPYNTYAIPALPAGPISNPGKESIEAALNPAESQFLFFVSHNDGTHEFTRTFEEHSLAVKKFQLDRKAREGKSWRDLKKAESTGAPAANAR